MGSKESNQTNYPSALTFVLGTHQDCSLSTPYMFWLRNKTINLSYLSRAWIIYIICVVFLYAEYHNPEVQLFSQAYMFSSEYYNSQLELADCL